VNSVSFNPSQKSSDGHKSIGRGGSFWLPQKMSAESFETNLKKFSSSTPSQKTLFPKSDRSGVGDRVSNESFKGLVSQSRPKSSINSSADKANHSSKVGVTANSLKKNYSANLRNSASLLRAKSSTSANPAPISHKIFAATSKMLPANKPTILPKSSSHINTCFPKNEVLKKRSSVYDGTKSAFGLSNDNFYKEQPQRSKNEFEQNQSGSFSFVQLSEKVSELLTDAPALFAFNQDVVRFAVTLENGSSVAVRIENMNDSFTVCFVSEDPQVLEDLQNKFSPKYFSSTEDQFSFNFHFFKSFNQMDLAFSKINSHS
jgi:hypothetical protein